MENRGRAVPLWTAHPWDLGLLRQRVRKETTEAGAAQEEGRGTSTEAGPACEVGDRHS